MTYRMTDCLLRRAAITLAVATLTAAPVSAQARTGVARGATASAAQKSGIPAGTYTNTVARADLPDSLAAAAVNAMVGTWTMTFDAAGHFTVRRNGELWVEADVKTSPEGHFRLDDKETGPHACHTPATYRYAIRSDSLTFTKVTDACAGRAFSLTVHPWTRIR